MTLCSLALPHLLTKQQLQKQRQQEETVNDRTPIQAYDRRPTVCPDLFGVLCIAAVFDRLDQARLADILGTNLQQLQLATALAVRLGFATRLNPGSTEDMTAAAGTPRVASSSSISALGRSSQLLASSGSGAIPDSVLDDSAGAVAGAAAATPGGERGQGAAAAAGSLWDVEGSSGGAVAVVVDAETTSFLMMGALSAGGAALCC